MMLRDRTAVVGIGSTDYSKNSGVGTLTLACQAILAALDDAGLSPTDVDGVACHRIADSADPATVAQSLGLRDLGFIRDVYGGGSVSTSVIASAAMAVATGMAECVVCWRSLNARSGLRMGAQGAGTAGLGDGQYWLPYRHLAAVQQFAMYARPYLSARGIRPEDLGRIAITQRAHATLNPRAMMRVAMTMDDYLRSRWIAEPLRKYDCCLETDAAVALVVTSRERAKDLRQPAICIAGVAFGAGTTLVSNFSPDQPCEAAQAMSRRLYKAAGLGPADIDVAQIYDAFTPLVFMQLEAYGLCPDGDPAGMVNDGATALSGVLPVNTHGGHLSEGYVHGLNHVVEAVQQLRGTCGDRQVDGAEVALATSQPGLGSGSTGALILRRL